jgi:CRP-like cAMP-binding protein
MLAGRAAGPAPLSEEARRLVDLPHFAGLPAARLETAARGAEALTVETGRVVVRQGDPADRFYVILDGRFGVTQRDAAGSERPLRELGPDQVFGELGLLGRTPRTATVTALTDGRLLTLGGDAFLELVGAGPGLSTRLQDLYRGGTGASLRD